MTKALAVLTLPLLVSACGLGVSDDQLARAQYLAQTGPYDTSAYSGPTADPLSVFSLRTWGYREHLLGVPGSAMD